MNDVISEKTAPEFKIGNRIPIDQSLKGKTSYFDNLFQSMSQVPNSLLQKTIFGCISACGIAPILGPSTVHFFTDTITHLQHHLPDVALSTHQTSPLVPHSNLLHPEGAYPSSTTNYDTLCNTAFFALLPAYHFFIQKIRNGPGSQQPHLAYALAISSLTHEMPHGMKPKHLDRSRILQISGFFGGGEEYEEPE